MVDVSDTLTIRNPKEQVSISAFALGRGWQDGPTGAFYSWHFIETRLYLKKRLPSILKRDILQ